MKDHNPRFRSTPLASCLTVALTLSPTAQALANATVFAPQAIASRGSVRNTVKLRAPDGSPQLGVVGARSASAVTHLPLVTSRVSGVVEVNGPHGLGRPNAHPIPPARGSQTPVTHFVDNCNAAGPGSLRDIVENVAASGDFIDLTRLSCNRIDTLTAIVANQDFLSLFGPGADELTIANAGNDGVIFHYGTRLDIQDLTIANGTRFTTDSSAAGGCLYSSGTISLTDSTVTGCHVDVAGSAEFHSVGGGVFAAGDLNMHNSKVTHCSIAARSGLRARGGGAFVGTRLFMDASEINYNTAGLYGVAGGLYVVNSDDTLGSVIRNSTIAGNQAYAVGALFLGPSEAVVDSRISNSTIAENTVNQFIGGIKDYARLSILNSTISGNHAQLLIDPITNDPIDSGLFFANTDVTLQSTLLAGNLAAGQPADISKYASSGSVSGSDNLIFAADCAVPGDTIEGVDPLLGNLGLHGGPTMTIDLLPGSPAINAGHNGNGDDYFEWDQRGSGYPRIDGANADIGAFETSPPILVLQPDTIDFGTIAVGGTGHADLTLSNSGSLQLTILEFGDSLPPFSNDFGSCGVPPTVLSPGVSCHIQYRFTPTTTGHFTQSIRITSDVRYGWISLTGTGISDRIFDNGFDP